MKTNKRSALQKLKEQGLRERFLSLKKMFEDETKEQADIELQFNKEIEHEKDKLSILEREQKVLETRVKCFEDENAEIELEIEKTQSMLDSLTLEIQREGSNWRNELQELNFKVIEQEHKNKKIRELGEDQEMRLYNDIERSLKQQQKTQHAQVMDAYKKLNEKRRRKKDDIIRRLREEGRQVLRELELEREGQSRMDKGLMKKREQYRDVIMKADHEIGLMRNQIRQVIDGK